MLKSLSRGKAIVVWFVVVAIALGASVLAGAVATPGTWALLVLTSLLPPALSLMIFRGAPRPTVAEVLHSVRSTEGR
jgi:hypothetical protein